MKKVVSIELGFENCEGCEIPIDYIASMWLGKLSSSLQFNALHKVFKETKTISEVYIAFERKCDLAEVDCNFGYGPEGRNLFERLQEYNDICWLHVIYDDDSKDDYQVTWNDPDNNLYNNPNQSFTNTYGFWELNIKETK